MIWWQVDNYCDKMYPTVPPPLPPAYSISPSQYKINNLRGAQRLYCNCKQEIGGVRGRRELTQWQSDFFWFIRTNWISFHGQCIMMYKFWRSARCTPTAGRVSVHKHLFIKGKIFWFLQYVFHHQQVNIISSPLNFFLCRRFLLSF